MRVNGAGAGAVAEAARALGIPVIHLSTDYVFDGNKTSAYDEEDSGRACQRLWRFEISRRTGGGRRHQRTTLFFVPHGFTHRMAKILCERCWRLPKAETKCVSLLISSDPRPMRPTSLSQSLTSRKIY